MDNFEYGTDSTGMGELDKQYNQLMIEEIIKAVTDTEAEVISELQGVWVGVSEKKFEADFDNYIIRLNESIQKEYKDLQERLKDISYNIYKADEDLYQSSALTQ